MFLLSYKHTIIKLKKILYVRYQLHVLFFTKLRQEVFPLFLKKRVIYITMKFEIPKEKNASSVIAKKICIIFKGIILYCNIYFVYQCNIFTYGYILVNNIKQSVIYKNNDTVVFIS